MMDKKKMIAKAQLWELDSSEINRLDRFRYYFRYYSVVCIKLSIYHNTFRDDPVLADEQEGYTSSGMVIVAILACNFLDFLQIRMVRSDRKLKLRERTPQTFVFVVNVPKCLL